MKVELNKAVKATLEYTDRDNGILTVFRKGNTSSEIHKFEISGNDYLNELSDNPIVTSVFNQKKTRFTVNVTKEYQSTVFINMIISKTAKMIKDLPEDVMEDLVTNKLDSQFIDSIVLYKNGKVLNLSVLFNQYTPIKNPLVEWVISGGDNIIPSKNYHDKVIDMGDAIVRK